LIYQAHIFNRTNNLLDLINQALTINQSLRFFLTGNSAGDRKRPIQKEGGLNERV
jgi:hypothetical protein